MFEVVYTVLDWYDGPRRGVADCKGHAHLFESEWRDREDVVADTFLLVPVDAETFALVLEDWTIWRRWETAFHKGMAARESHPALPEDQERHRELQHLLEGRLTVDSIKAIRRKAEFRVRHDPEWSGHGWSPLGSAMGGRRRRSCRALN